MSDALPKLRLTAPEAAEPVSRPRGTAPFRIGSVKYLNAAPLTRGIESEIFFATPARLAEMLRRDELDAALVSITEVLLNDRYDILDGIAIASLDEVYSVLLAHRKPLTEAKEIFCDPASLTSVNLLKVLLAERGLKPEFKPLESYAAAAEKDFVLLIGDRAIGGQAGSFQLIWDLGDEWCRWTGLPFVFAVWAARRDVPAAELARIERLLTQARDHGRTHLAAIAAAEAASHGLTVQQCLGYLRDNLHYCLGTQERLALAAFYAYASKLALAPAGLDVASTMAPAPSP